MEETPPPRAMASDDRSVSARATEKAKPRPRPWWRRLRVPSSVLVTIMVAALSVWIAPAITRQWDDREKARELQGNVAEQVSVASADVVGELLALADSHSSS